MRDRTELKLVALPIAGPFGVFLLFAVGYIYAIYVTIHVTVWLIIVLVKAIRRGIRKAEYARKNGLL